MRRGVPPVTGVPGMLSVPGVGYNPARLRA